MEAPGSTSCEDTKASWMFPSGAPLQSPQEEVLDNQAVEMVSLPVTVTQPISFVTPVHPQ